jgi:copper(I)-binding protein
VIRLSALRLPAIAAAVALIPALAGCAAGVNAQTNRPFATTDGASAVFHDIAIRNVFVLGPVVSATLQPGQTAGMFLALFNQGPPDRLVAVDAIGTAASVTIHGGVVPLVPGQPQLLTGPAPQIVLNGLTRSLVGGQFIPVAFTFENAGTLVLSVPVAPRANSYATFLPPAPSPTPATTKRGSQTARPSPTSSARSARATPTPTPSTTP